MVTKNATYLVCHVTVINTKAYAGCVLRAAYGAPLTLSFKQRVELLWRNVVATTTMVFIVGFSVFAPPFIGAGFVT